MKRVLYLILSFFIVAYAILYISKEDDTPPTPAEYGAFIGEIHDNATQTLGEILDMLFNKKERD